MSEGEGCGNWVAIDPNLSLQCSSHTRKINMVSLSLSLCVWDEVVVVVVVCVCVCARRGEGGIRVSVREGYG